MCYCLSVIGTILILPSLGQFAIIGTHFIGLLAQVIPNKLFTSNQLCTVIDVFIALITFFAVSYTKMQPQVVYT